MSIIMVRFDFRLFQLSACLPYLPPLLMKRSKKEGKDQESIQSSTTRVYFLFRVPGIDFSFLFDS